MRVDQIDISQRTHAGLGLCGQAPLLLVPSRVVLYPPNYIDLRRPNDFESAALTPGLAGATALDSTPASGAIRFTIVVIKLFFFRR